MQSIAWNGVNCIIVTGHARIRYDQDLKIEHSMQSSWD